MFSLLFFSSRYLVYQLGEVRESGRPSATAAVGRALPIGRAVYVVLMLVLSFPATPVYIDVELSVNPDEARDFEEKEASTTSPAAEGRWRIPKKDPAKPSTSSAVVVPDKPTAPRRPRRRRQRRGVHYPQPSFLWPGRAQDRRIEYRHYSPVRVTEPRTERSSSTVVRECQPCKNVQSELEKAKDTGEKMAAVMVQLRKELVDERAKVAAVKTELATAKVAGSSMDHRERMSWSHQLVLMRSAMMNLEGRLAHNQKVQGLQVAEKNILEMRVRSLDVELLRMRDTFRKTVTHAAQCTGPDCQHDCHKLNWGEDA